MHSRSILITGGTGFIGSHLCRRLLNEGAHVHLLVRPQSSTERIHDFADRLTLWKGDLTDPASVHRCVEGSRPEWIFHIAGDSDVRRLSPDLSQLDASVEVNLKGTLNLLKAAHAMKTPPTRFIRLGGLEEYGHGPLPYDESQREDPSSPYSASQVATTYYCQMLQKHLGFSILTLRPALVYGPAQSLKFLIPSLITHCLQGKDFELASETNGRDLLYIDDLIEGLVRSTGCPDVAGEVINLGSGKEYKNQYVADEILRLLGNGIRLKLGIAAKRSVEIPHLRCRNEKALSLLQWKPQVSLEEGLPQTIEWYRKHRSR